MNKLFYQFTKNVLFEITRYQKETGKPYSPRQEIESLITDEDMSQYAFTMTSVPKVGINPSTNFDTPAGVYFYPLNSEYFDRLVDDRLQYASDSPFVNLVKLNISKESKWLYLSHFKQSHMKLSEIIDMLENVCIKNRYDMDKIQVIFNNYAAKKNNEYKDKTIYDLAGKISTEQSKSSGVRQTVIFRKILVDLGYIGVYDDKTGTIYSSEPTQLVCLDNSAYSFVGTYSTNEIRKKQIDAEQLKNINRSISNEKNPDKICDAYDNLVEYDFPDNGDIPNYIKEIISNPHTPEFLLMKILKDKQYSKGSVASAAIMNPNLTPNVASYLFNNNQNFVSKLFRKNYEHPFLNKISHEIQKKIKPDILNVFSQGKNYHDFWTIVESEILNPDIIYDFWYSRKNPRADENTSKMIASNENTPEEILLDIFNVWKSEKSVMFSLLGNPSLSSDVIKKIYDSYGSSAIDDAYLLSKFAKLPATPKEILDDICKKTLIDINNTTGAVPDDIVYLTESICSNESLDSKYFFKFYEIAKQKKLKKMIRHIFRNRSCPESIKNDILSAERNITISEDMITRNNLPESDLLKILTKRQELALVILPRLSLKTIRSIATGNVPGIFVNKKYAINAYNHAVKVHRIKRWLDENQ